MFQVVGEGGRCGDMRIVIAVPAGGAFDLSGATEDIVPILDSQLGES